MPTTRSVNKSSPIYEILKSLGESWQEIEPQITDKVPPETIEEFSTSFTALVEKMGDFTGKEVMQEHYSRN